MAEASPNLDRFAERAGVLYSLPAVAVEMLRLTELPKVDVAALKGCLENDPALTIKVLKVVNSPLFGLPQEVRDLGQAITLLGIKPLKLLVLGFSLPERLLVGMAHDVLTNYWRRTLTKAIAARELTELYWRAPGEEAFIAGLLSDVGQLVLFKELGESYASFMRRVIDQLIDLPTAQREVLGFDHIALGTKLLEQWGFPASLTQAIAAHRQLDGQPRGKHEPRLAPVLHLAELLAQVVTEHRIGALQELLDAAQAYRAITATEINMLVEDLNNKVNQLAEVLSLEVASATNYAEVLAESHARLAELAEDAAIGMVIRERDNRDLCDDLLAQAKELSAAVRAVARSPIPKLPAASLAPAAVEVTSMSAEAAPMTANPALSQTIDWQPRGAEPDAALAGPLATAVHCCRQARCELSLLLVQLDRYAEHLTTNADRIAQFVTLVGAACRTLEHPHVQPLLTGPGRFALVLPQCDRNAAVEMAKQLVRRVRLLGQREYPELAPPLTLSVGCATVDLPHRSFAPAELQAAASRCLYNAQSSGGNTAKSIGI